MLPGVAHAGALDGSVATTDDASALGSVAVTPFTLFWPSRIPARMATDAATATAPAGNQPQPDAAGARRCNAPPPGVAAFCLAPCANSLDWVDAFAQI